MLHIMDSGRRMNCTQSPQSRISPACSTSSAGGSVRRISAHVQQPSLLNIDLTSTVREQQVQTSNTIFTDKYNPVRSIHQTHAKHLKCYKCTISAKRVNAINHQWNIAHSVINQPVMYMTYLIKSMLCRYIYIIFDTTCVRKYLLS